MKYTNYICYSAILVTGIISGAYFSDNTLQLQATNSGSIINSKSHYEIIDVAKKEKTINAYIENELKRSGCVDSDKVKVRVKQLSSDIIYIYERPQYSQKMAILSSFNRQYPNVAGILNEHIMQTINHAIDMDMQNRL